MPFWVKINTNFSGGKKSAKKLFSICIFSQMPKEINHPMGKNSPNLVNLAPT
jgi:hypothetical protein